jgi:ribonuclease Z
MTWLVQPSLVNEPYADLGLFIDFRFGRRALLFDLGDLTPLSPRQLLRVTHCFVSHTHMDHFAGFDRLLRVCLHRTTPLHLIGPTGFVDNVEHKLKAYTLNLLDAQSVDFVILAAEFNGAGFDRVCEFRAREAFRRGDMPEVNLSPGVLVDEDEFRVNGAVLDHGIPCLAFALTEKLRVNVWSDGLKQLGLAVGRGFARPRVRCGRARRMIARFSLAAMCQCHWAFSNGTLCALRGGKKSPMWSTSPIMTRTSKKLSR